MRWPSLVSPAPGAAARAFADAGGVAGATTDVNAADAIGGAIATTAVGVWGAVEVRSTAAGSITQVVDVFLPADTYGSTGLVAAAGTAVIRWCFEFKPFNVVPVPA